MRAHFGLPSVRNGMLICFLLWLTLKRSHLLAARPSTSSLKYPTLPSQAFKYGTSRLLKSLATRHCVRILAFVTNMADTGAFSMGPLYHTGLYLTMIWRIKANLAEWRIRSPHTKRKITGATCPFHIVGH